MYKINLFHHSVKNNYTILFIAVDINYSYFYDVHMVLYNVQYVCVHAYTASEWEICIPNIYIFYIIQLLFSSRGATTFRIP
jgi:hypothetical protein